VEHIRKKERFNIGLTYIFAAISAIIALFFIYRISLDLYDPVEMETSLQMMNLSEKQIILLDMIEIFSYVILIVFIVIGAIKKNKKLMLIGGISIWLFILIFFCYCRTLFSI